MYKYFLAKLLLQYCILFIFIRLVCELLEMMLISIKLLLMYVEFYNATL